MSEQEAQAGGWFDSIRRIGESALSLLRVRLEVLAVEMHEEKLRLLDLLVWLCVAIIFGVAGVMAAMAVLAFWLWNVIGYGGLVLVTVIPLIVTIAIFLRIRREIRFGPPPFESTFGALKDGKCLPRK